MSVLFKLLVILTVIVVIQIAIYKQCQNPEIEAGSANCYVTNKLVKEYLK